jgi:hypothetical protein
MGEALLASCDQPPPGTIRASSLGERRNQEVRWTSLDRMSGAIRGITSNRDTPVPLASDFGPHVAFEFDRKSASLPETASEVGLALSDANSEASCPILSGFAA